ncbi:hypothetical protein [Streptomyces sp. NPDC057681]|uniref:hypothetical protein n=1 Tax=unclassified Streptomyces TaxID=2593676 RepID=UPI0036AAD253
MTVRPATLIKKPTPVRKGIFVCVRVFILVALALDVLLFIGLSTFDLLKYTDTGIQSFSVLLRFSIGVLNAIALWGALQIPILPRRWWRSPTKFPSVNPKDWKWASIICAQMAAVPFLFFPILIERWSPVHDGLDLLITITSATLLAAAFCIIGHIARHHPAPSLAWKALGALFPLAGAVQFWYQAYYQPTHDRPRVDITAQVEDVGHSGNMAHMRGSISLHNTGAAAVDVLGSMYKVAGYRVRENNPDGSKANLRAVMDGANPNLHHFLGGEKFLTADDILPTGDTLTPGQQWKTSFVFDADVTKQNMVLLTADLSLVTHGSEISPAKCKDGELKISLAVCMHTSFRPASSMRDALGDDPFSRVYVDYKAPGSKKESTLPYFHITYSANDGRMSDADAQKANPRAVTANPEILEAYRLRDPNRANP